MRSANLPGALAHIRGGAVEIACSLALALITLAVLVVHPQPPLALSLSLMLCLGCALAGRRLTLAAVLIAIAMAAVVQLPPPQIGPAFHACLVPLFTARRLGRAVHAWAVTAGYLLLILYMTSRDAGTPQQVFVYMLTWVLLFALVATLGGFIASAQHRAEQHRRTVMAAQSRRYAQHLHDTVAHDLSMIIMTSQQAELAGSATPEKLAQIRRTAQQSVGGLRAFMDALDQGDFDASKIEAPLPELIAQRTNELRRAGFTAVTSTEGDITALPGRVSRCMARVAREALNNVQRHASSTGPVVVMTEITSSTISLLIVNDRRGADAPEPQRRSHGLQGMRQDIARAGGSLHAGPHRDLWTLRATCPIFDPANHQEV